MAEDRKALLRRKAARSALQGTPQSEDVRNRIQDVLALSGGVLASGASYDQLMRTIREYAERTHQPLGRVLRDSVQLEGIIGGELEFRRGRVPLKAVGSMGTPAEKSLRVQARRRALANVIMEHGGDLGGGGLTPQELKSMRAAVLAGDINELPSDIRAQLHDISERVKKAQKIARRDIRPIILHSPGGESPRLAKFANESRTLHRPREVMESWKKNVDPEFLEKLSFVHWTNAPESLAIGRGIPSTNGSLSAGIYFRGDPTGHGFVTNKFASAPYGLVFEGDVTWAGNRDVYSAGGTIGSPSMDYSMDPILDEATFETQATRMERRMLDSVGGQRPNIEDYPFDFQPNINEALIKKPRVVGVVVDPGTYNLLMLQNTYKTKASQQRVLTRAMVFAEEMGIPIYDIAGRPLPEVFQPESVDPAEIKRVARNFPSAAELTGGKGYARTAGGKSLFQALAELEGRASVGQLVALPETPSIQDMRVARAALEEPNYGGKKRARLRTEMRKRLLQESQLHSGEIPNVKHKTPWGHTVHLDDPLSTPEEFAEAWRFERLKKNFKESGPHTLGGPESYAAYAPENPLFSDPSLTEGLHPASSAEEIFEALIKKPEKASLLETLTLMEQVGEEGRGLFDDWTKLKAVQGEKVTPLETQSKLKEIYDTLAEEAREMGKEDAHRFMVGEAEAKTLSQEEVQGEEEAAKRRSERRAARPSLDDLLQEEGIPRESFIDFSELPENQGKPTRSVIEAYKIAGELPESAGIPEGRSPKAYPLKGLSPEEPTLRPGTAVDEFGETVRQPTSQVGDPTPEQKAFAAQDPEARLSVVEGSSPEYKPQLSVEKARAALADPAQQDDFIHWLATRDPEARIPDKYADLTPTPVEAEWKGGTAKANDGMQDLVQRFRHGEISSKDFQKILRTRMGAGPQDTVVFRGVPSGGLNLGSWSGADEARFQELIALPEHTPQTRAEGQRLWERKRTAGGQFFSDTPEVALQYAKDTGTVHAMKLSPEEVLKWSKGTVQTPGGISSNFQIPNEAIQASQAGGGGFLEIEEEVAKVLEDIASGKVETTPEARKALLADKAVKAKWGPRIVKGLTVLGDVALAADLGYQLGKHGPSGIMDVGAHTVEGAALMAELPEMALKRTPGRELREEAGALTPTEHLAGAAGKAGRAVKGTMDPFRRHRDRQERVKKLEGLQAEYERAGLDTMAARRQAAADIAAGGVAFYQTAQIADRLRWDPERARRELRQERRPPTDPSRLAQWGLKEDAENQRDAAWHEELEKLADIDLGIEEEPEPPPMTTDPREMARWAAKRALEK